MKLIFYYKINARDYCLQEIKMSFTSSIIIVRTEGEIKNSKTITDCFKDSKLITEYIIVFYKWCNDSVTRKIEYVRWDGASYFVSFNEVNTHKIESR